MSVYKQNGIPASQLQEQFDALRDAADLTTRCALCGDTFTGTALQGRTHAAEHRAEHHPDIRPAKRRRVSLHKFVNRDDGWRGEGVAKAAEVARMINRHGNEAA